MLNNTQQKCLNCLELAHTSIHQAIDLLKKESLNDCKAKQAEVLKYIATCLQYL